MSRLRPKSPRLAPIPGVEVSYRPDLNSVHCWVALVDGRIVAKSPWKKHTWKMADLYMRRMG